MEETAIWPGNARTELHGALLRDEEGTKRYPVSGSIVCLIEAEPMDTLPTSRADGLRSR